MAEMTVTVPATSVMKTTSLELRVTGIPTLKLRLHLASFLFRVAARVLGVGQIQLTFDP